MYKRRYKTKVIYKHIVFVLQIRKFFISICLSYTTMSKGLILIIKLG